MNRSSSSLQWRIATHSRPLWRPTRLMGVSAALLVAVGLGQSFPALAQKADQQESEAPRQEPPEEVQRQGQRMFDDPLSGVAVNRTVTVLGKEFYRHFTTFWRTNPESQRYSISIYERPSARFGSEVWVLYGQQRMFHIFLPPARQATRGISEIAVDQVLKNISRRELERLTTRNPDLGPEEL